MKELAVITAILILCLVINACGSLQPESDPIPADTYHPSTENPTVPSSPGPLPPLQPITIGNAEQVQLLRTMEIPGYTRGRTSQCNVAFSPDGHLLVGACGKNQLPVWDIQSGVIKQYLSDSSQQIVTCIFHPDGTSIACGGVDGKITFWDPDTGEQVRDFASHGSPVWELAYSADGQKLVSCGFTSDIRLWSVVSGELLWSYKGKGAYLSVSFDPSGETIAYGGRWGDAGLLEVLTGKNVLDLNVTGTQPIGDVTFSPSGKFLVAGTDDDFIHLWETGQGQLLTTLKGHLDYVNGVSFNPDETLLASGSHDHTVGIWDVAGQKPLKTLIGHEDAVLRVSFSPDGTLIASISWDGTVSLWGVPK